MKREQMMVKVAELTHCGWNPRSEEELDVKHPAMIELVASDNVLGVVQPIAVWKRDDGDMVVIAGNRRFAAAKILKLKEVQAVVFTGIDEARAREITRVENEVRLGVDPIADATLIGEMIGLGYTQKEIAAHFGVCEAMICRRAKLRMLTPKLMELAKGCRKITVDALERMAMFSPEIQNKCFDYVKRNAVRRDRVTWEDVSWNFTSETRDLDNVQFCTDDCLRCANRTGALGDLFAGSDDAQDDALGRCLNVSCFAEKLRAWQASRIRKALDTDGPIVNIRGDEFPGDYFHSAKELIQAFPKSFSERGSKTRNTIYYTSFSDGAVASRCWGPSIEAFTADCESRRAKVAAEEARRREEDKAIRAANDEIYELRRPLADAVLDVDNEVDNAMQELDVDNFTKQVRNLLMRGVPSAKLADDLAAAIACAFDDYVYIKKHPLAPARLETFDDFSEGSYLSADLAKRCLAAHKALDEFDRKHPMMKRQ